jgi:hypothetical protein
MKRPSGKAPAALTAPLWNRSTDTAAPASICQTMID